MSKNSDVFDRSEDVKLGFLATAVQACFYQKGPAKQFGGAVAVSALLAVLFMIGQGVSSEGSLFTWYSASFIFLSAVTAIAVQNFIMFAWVANLEPVDLENAQARAEKIVERCKKRHRLFVKLSLAIYVAIIGIELGIPSEYEAYLKVLFNNPALWLLPSFIIFIHMIINTAHVVEIMRIHNIAGQKQELLAALEGRTKLYSHQIVTMTEGLVSPRMLCGYAIGACIVQFLISSPT